MGSLVMKSALTPSRQCLVILMQRVNFGRIENLHICNGEPLFDPPPRVFREIKFGRENAARPEADTSDFMLKSEVLDLLAQLEAVGDGVIFRLEVQRGLPFRMTCEEDVAG